MKKIVVNVVCFMLGTAAFAGNAKEIILPKPDLTSGKPLMVCIANRATQRAFSTKALPQQIISEVLFVADGITRQDGRKTVPTARNKQNQSVYAFTADGIYLYNSKKHSMILVKKGDFRKNCGFQAFHKKVPLVLVFVSDMKAIGDTAELQALYAGNHSGSASQNVYLYAASKGLATVVCGLLDREAIKKILNLPKDHMVIFSQPVGYPAK